MKNIMLVQNGHQVQDIKRLNRISKSTKNHPNNLLNNSRNNIPNDPEPDLNNHETSHFNSLLNPLPKRTTSAQSISSSFSKQQHKYQRCIEYLQSQHEQTLTSLHQEVQELKSENKRLNFKIQVESNNQDGVSSIVKNTLGAKAAVNKTISKELILEETIKDMQVKLNLSQDTNQHQEKTIKALNKQMKTMSSGSGEMCGGLKEFKKISSPRVTRPSPPPLKNENAEKDKLIFALKDQNKALLDKIDEQQNVIHSLSFNNRRVSNSMSNSVSGENSGTLPVLSDSRILFNPVTSLPPINHVSRVPQNSRNGRNVITPRTSRTDISRRTKRKEQ
jgi:hypothetical protein